MIIKVISSLILQQVEDFTIAAPAVMPKKPKVLSRKRSLDHDSQEDPSNAEKQARAFGGSAALPDNIAPLPEKQNLAPARTAALSQSTSVALSKLHMDGPLERALLDSNIQAPAAAQAASMQGPQVERATEPVLKPPPPPQQVGKKWRSFIDNEDVW